MAAPAINNIGVAIKNGKKALFSCLYKPSTTNNHIWLANNGNVKNIAIHMANLIWVKNASANPVKMKRGFSCPFSIISCAKGCDRKS